jgi:phasin
MTDTREPRAARAARATVAAAEENMERAAETLRSELPSSFIDLFEKSFARTKDMHEKMSSVLEHSTEAFEEAFSCANRGSTEYRVKLMEIARTNANSAFDLAREAFEVKSLPELMELTIAHQRKQFELAAAQLKELSALTQKVVTETTEPIRNGITEPFRLAS